MSEVVEDRVSRYGEVFTAKREVVAMVDLVAVEADRIDSRFLEPACGDGNFLIEVLERKLQVVKRRYSADRLEYERNSFTAVGSVYGIDLLEDNVLDCRRRLFTLVRDEYRCAFGDQPSERFLQAISYVLEKNILRGDALSLTEADGESPLVFSEWCFALQSKVRRTEYTFDNLLAYQPFEEGSLFSDLGDEAFLPHPLRKFPLCHFLDVPCGKI